MENRSDFVREAIRPRLQQALSGLEDSGIVYGVMPAGGMHAQGDAGQDKGAGAARGEAHAWNEWVYVEADGIPAPCRDSIHRAPYEVSLARNALAGPVPAIVCLGVRLADEAPQGRTLRFANLALIKSALGAGSSWRRHVPPALLFLAFCAFVLAAARPMTSLTLPSQQRTILMVMDVSGSMRATDVSPDRVTASQAAAKAFATELPASVRIGVVAYAGTAQLVRPPTLSREDVVAAIDRFQLQRGTAIGNRIIIALATMFPEANIDLSKITGQRNMPGPLQRNGVKVFTVGFGTKEGETIGFDGWSMRVRLDEDTLKRIANLTLGEYFHAGSGADLKRVYEALKSRLVFEKKETEVTALFADAAALLVLLAAGLSVAWFGRVA
jgi:Ca-activated chloride channel family protein